MKQLYQSLSTCTGDDPLTKASGLSPDEDGHTMVQILLMVPLVYFRLAIAYYIVTICSCNVLLLEYRGYGKSSGSPSESGG